MADTNLIAPVIDYSQVQSDPGQNPGEDWEPPTRVYFGKRMPNGKSEKEPPYVHKSYPKMIYTLGPRGPIARLVQNEAEREKYPEYGESLLELGVETAPGAEAVAQKKMHIADTTPETTMETVEIVRRPLGVPKKVA